MSLPEAALTPLLHGAAMLLFTAMMGFSTTLCLRRNPSPYSIVALHEYVAVTRVFDTLWLILATGWIVTAFARGGTTWFASPVYVALATTAILITLLMIGAHAGYRGTLAPKLAHEAARVSAQGPVTTTDAEGTLVPHRRGPEEPSAFTVTRPGVPLYLVALALTTGLFVWAALAFGAGSSNARLAQTVLLAGLWGSLGVIAIDLCEDVFPGFTTHARLERAARYYVQVFEQWKNLGVVAALLTVLVGGPLAWSLGYAPVAVISFSVWTGSCLVFATFFNQVLRPNGLVESQLPLPVWVNRYSVSLPLWAHFFAIIHSIMALGLALGLIGLHRALV